MQVYFVSLSTLQVLPLIPITALVIQNSVTMNTLLGYQNRVSTIRRQVRDTEEIVVLIGQSSLALQMSVGLSVNIFLKLLKGSYKQTWTLTLTLMLTLTMILTLTLTLT